MKIIRLVLGFLEANCYILVKNNKCLIIDPGDNCEDIISKCENYQVVGILITHHHFDHCGALKELEDYYHLKHNTFNDSFSYEVIATKGHSKDSLTFYFKEESIMFTGDFIFYHSIGRIDFPDSSKEDMINSLNKIKAYDDFITIYPGHGPMTILGEEKKLFNNYFGG